MADRKESAIYKLAPTRPPRPATAMHKKTATPDAASQETRLYRVVADRIQQLIVAERIAPGERLPSERDLATKLSVSRASLREALIALELGGVSEVRGGSGVYVSEPTLPAGGLPEAGPGPFEVLSARRLIESEIAARSEEHTSELQSHSDLV